MDDEKSSDGNALSAIAKVAAINRVSEASGVVAKAGVTTVSGTSMTGLATTGFITINGYTTASISTTTDTALSRKLVTDAINAISKATGVTATDTQNDTNGVVLQAADGRNIQLALSTLTAASTGIAVADTYVGSFELYSVNGGAINIDSKKLNATTAVSAAGLRLGTFEGGVAQTVTRHRATGDESAALTTTSGVMTGSTLVINGIAIGGSVSSDDTASYQSSGTTGGNQRSASAIAIAAAINKQTDRTGVTAKAEANTLRGTGFTSASTSATVWLNGVTFTTDVSDIQNVIDSFNEVSGRTGVIASRQGDALQLQAADGRNIAIGASVGTAANLGLNGVSIGTAAATLVTHYASVKLESDTAFTVNAGYEGKTQFELLGFRAGTFGGAKGDKIAEVDISTQQGATDALRAIDAAINQVSAAQANSGALNNRLDAIINNLSEGLQNMSASRSRILDTDYATETAVLAKQRIMQQAATARLAQAHQQAQGVLALLR